MEQSLIDRSRHTEYFKNVNVEWDRETGVLNIESLDGKQLALMYVREVD